ncbi:MAG TPA: peptidase T [Planctomycetaceae bacterium]|nr:peptidase T [Planctomycetaceae bacterium]
MININTDLLLERFLRYVRVETTANPTVDTYPSSPGQIELGRMLASELEEMGATAVEQDKHGLVWATIPSSDSAVRCPTILLNAHMDTSPDAPGKDVKPQVVEDYEGGDIPLKTGGRVITQADCPALANLLGHTLITTDGSTLLGGDDKAGVAIIMQTAEHLLRNPQLEHGEIRILFTCDEEIGRGANHIDLTKAAADAAYTLDGGGECIVEDENFSADHLVMTCAGINIHPSIGKGRMVNALRAVAFVLSALPEDNLSPETTDGMQGFVHPYLTNGTVESTRVEFLLRDFETSQLDAHETLLKSLAAEAETKYAGVKFEFERTKQYRNMGDALRSAPHIVQHAIAAHKQLGKTANRGSIRGGTDGALFSEMGLPTPNLSSGQHNLHSVTEFASLDQMTYAAEHLVALLQIWHRSSKDAAQ